MGMSFCSSNATETVTAGEANIVDQEKKKIDKITLYWHLIDPNSRAIKSLLVAGGVKHNEVYVDVTKGQQKQQDILELNPSG